MLPTRLCSHGVVLKRVLRLRTQVLFLSTQQAASKNRQNLERHCLVLPPLPLHAPKLARGMG